MRNDRVAIFLMIEFDVLSVYSLKHEYDVTEKSRLRNFRSTCQNPKKKRIRAKEQWRGKNKIIPPHFFFSWKTNKFFFCGSQLVALNSSIFASVSSSTWRSEREEFEINALVSFEIYKKMKYIFPSLLLPISVFFFITVDFFFFDYRYLARPLS